MMFAQLISDLQVLRAGLFEQSNLEGIADEIETIKAVRESIESGNVCNENLGRRKGDKAIEELKEHRARIMQEVGEVLGKR